MSLTVRHSDAPPPYSETPYSATPVHSATPYVNANPVSSANFPIAPQAHSGSLVTHSLVPHFLGTKTKVYRAALYSLSAVCAGLGLVKLAKKSDDSILSVPLFLSSGGAAYFAWNLKDYEDPKELAVMKNQALGLSFEEITGRHKLDNVVKYGVVDRIALREKFEREYNGMNLSFVLKKHPFSVIEKYELASNSYLHKLLGWELGTLHVSNLKKHFLQECFLADLLTKDALEFFTDVCDRVETELKNYNQRIEVINQKYPHRTERLLQDLMLEEGRVPQEARELQRQMLRNGYAATNSQANGRTVLDVVFTTKSAETLVNDHVDRRIQGQAVTEQAARQTADDFTTRRMVEIAANREMIRKKNLGGADQRLYNEEAATVKQDYDLAIDKAQQQFKGLVQTFFSASV